MQTGLYEPTARFFAAILNTLSGISSERMDELAKDSNQPKLRRLLTPLRDNRLVFLAEHASDYVTLSWQQCEGPKTIRTVLEEARERKFAPLGLIAATSLAELIRESSLGFHSTIFTIPFYDPDVGRVLQDTVQAFEVDCSDHSLCETTFRLDEQQDELSHRRFIFQHALQDRSTCFAC